MRELQSIRGGRGQAKLCGRCSAPRQVYYRVPAAGKYQLHISCREPPSAASGGALAPIRGSPFSVEAVDPWKRRRLAGALPAKRLVSG